MLGKEELVRRLRVDDHVAEFSVGQGAGLVQHLGRDCDLADVVQQPGQAGVAHFVV